MSTGAPSPARVAATLALAALLAVRGAHAQEPAPDDAVRTPGAAGPLRITADPPRLVLGREAGAELRVAAPPDVTELSMTASAGRIEGLRRLPGGGFTARFRPPAEQVPQVAIVSAFGRGARGPEDGWLAIPMSGSGTARVRGAPGTEVSLRVGDHTFGPQTAGPDGFAAIPVVVPPGIREGHQGFRPIDLDVPETSLVHAIADRMDLHADREEQVRVFAFVVAPHGAARRGDPPAFEPSRGTVAVLEREPGAYHATWTLPPGPAGEERLTVRLPSAPASRAVLRAVGVPGPPALVAVSFDRAELVAGAEPATVTARALDGGGNQVPAVLALDARGGVLTDVTERRPGELVARIAAGPRLQGAEAVVTATASALRLSGAAALPLRAGEAASARFARQAAVRGDGVRETVLRLSVADRFGNAVASPPTVTSARGRVLGVAPGAGGAFEVRYLPPAVDRPVLDAVSARSGAARATLSPLVTPAPPALRLEARLGSALDLAGRFAGPAGAVAAERTIDAAFALRGGLEPAARLEVGALAGRDGAALATLLAGVSARRAPAGRAVWAASATAGVAVGSRGGGLAARLALSLGLAGDRAEPFLEASVLAAREGAPGSFLAAGVSVGVRFGVEARDAHDPDCR